MDIASFEQFLTERIKVGGKAGALGRRRLGVLGQELRHRLLRICHEQEILEIPHEEVLEEAQRQRLVESDCLNKDRNVYEVEISFNILRRSTKKNKNNGLLKRIQ